MKTVKDLIEELKKFPEEAKVCAYEGEIVIVQDIAFGEELSMADRHLKHKEIGCIELEFN